MTLERRVLANTKSAQTYEMLKEDICNGRLKPGTRLIISRIAESFGTSDIPVREAINRLEAEDLLTIVPHTGIYVTEIHAEHLQELYPIRGILEGYATRLASPHLTMKDFDHLSGLIGKMDSVVEQGKYPEMGILNYDFHMRIYRASRNEHLINMINEIWGKTTRVRGIFGLMPKIAARSNKEHGGILEALRNYDKRKAERRIIQQNERTLNSMIRYLKERE